MSAEYSSEIKEGLQTEFDHDDEEVCVPEATGTGTINIRNSELGHDNNTDSPSLEVSDTISNNCKIENEFVINELQDEYDDKVCVSETTVTDAINISNSELSHDNNTDFPSLEVSHTISNNCNIGNEFVIDEVQDEYHYDDKVCVSETTVTELVQRPVCKEKDYIQNNKDYGCGTNNGDSVSAIPELHKLEAKRRSSLSSKANIRKRKVYKCTQCKFKTMYIADLRHHSNKHYELKMYKCAICRRRYNTKKSLKTHEERVHANNEGGNIKNIKRRSLPLHDDGKQTQDKNNLKSLIKMKHLNSHFKTYFRSYVKMEMKHLMENSSEHLNQEDYKCAMCKYQTKSKSSFVKHTDDKHLYQKVYKCLECEYQSKSNSSFKKHTKAKHLNIKDKHLNQEDYKCSECEFQTKCKSNLEQHGKDKHPNQKNYKCTVCKFKTKCNSSLQQHMKKKHLNQEDYKCTECEFQTKSKSSLEKHTNDKHLNQKNDKYTVCKFKTKRNSSVQRHMKTKHLNQEDYKCTECEFQTKSKSSFQQHTKDKHLKHKDYKCSLCKFKTKRNSSLQQHVESKH